MTDYAVFLRARALMAYFAGGLRGSVNDDAG
jgi:hypothetical protein